MMRRVEFREVVRRRRMVRSYAPDEVPAAAVDRVLAHALRAPSAGFTQGSTFLVLDRRQDVDRFWDVTTPPERAARPDRWLRGMRTAPVVIVPLSCEEAYRRRYAEPDKSRRGTGPDGWTVPYWHLDTAMAVLLVLQTAVDEGLGACFFGVPADRVQALRDAFGIPADRTPIGAVTLGRPAPDETVSGSPTGRPRRPAQDAVHRGRWGG